MVPAKPTVCHCVVNFVRTVEHGEGTRRGVKRSVNSGETRRDPAKVLDILKTFRRVGTSGGTRWEPGMRTVGGRGPGTRPLWTRSWGSAHIILHSDGLLTCACRPDNIFRSGNIYFGVAIHFSGRQNIFQSGKRYFRASIDILEQHYIFQRRRYVYGEDTVRKTSWNCMGTESSVPGRAGPGIDPV